MGDPRQGHAGYRIRGNPASRIRSSLDWHRDLQAWDIIDLSNLPEGDNPIATQALLLRQLYVPLRITGEVGGDIGSADKALLELEQRREERRLWEAGWADRRLSGERKPSRSLRGQASLSASV